ncbi:MAG TPA: nuclear transport factor 2 family protein [Gemmatimonadaceae bacterium]|nr:nuclear transport factor 2 family protein [Gemmatimonadaceae bacterium]
MIQATILRVAAAAVVVIAGQATAQRPAPTDDQLRDIALRVAELDARRQFPTATLATIDSLLAFYADSVVYEHPSVGAVVRGKAAMRTGMQRFIGSVRAGATDVPRITIGAGVAVLATTAHPDPRDPSKPVPSTRKALRIFEFDAQGLVRRIIDYPW